MEKKPARMSFKDKTSILTLFCEYCGRGFHVSTILPTAMRAFLRTYLKSQKQQAGEYLIDENLESLQILCTDCGAEIEVAECHNTPESVQVAKPK